jgi:hypothetical protein
MAPSKRPPSGGFFFYSGNSGSDPGEPEPVHGAEWKGLAESFDIREMIRGQHGQLDKKNACRRKSSGSVCRGGSELPEVRKTDDTEDRAARGARAVPVLGMRGVSGVPGDANAQIELGRR